MLVDKASGEIGDLGDLERLSGEGDDDMKRARSRSLTIEMPVESS